MFVSFAGGESIDWVWNGNSDCGGCDGEQKREYDRVGVGLHDESFRLHYSTRHKAADSICS